MGSTSTSDECPNVITCQLVAIPYPGRGHINQLMNFCKLIAAKRSDFLINFVVTEEWRGFLSSEPIPGHNFRFATIPNVIPSEIGRARDCVTFLEAVMTKMEAPVDHLLDQFNPPKPRVIIYDSILRWVLGVANRRSIPAASFWPLSATFFTVLDHFDSLRQNGQVPANLLEQGEHRINSIPGIPSISIADIPKPLLEGKSVQDAFPFLSVLNRADFILIASVYELESRVIYNFKMELPCPVYTIGLSIPSFISINGHNDHDHISWLDAQPRTSVLYISQGSYRSSSDEQLDEYVYGVRESGIRFFWVARENRDRFLEIFGGFDSCNNGLILSWCDQLRVLSHPSIVGFWSHCGWNSAKEAAFSGVPVLACRIGMDQCVNSKLIVENWKMGWRLTENDDGALLERGEISRILKRFLDSDCEEVQETMRKAQEIRDISRAASSGCGS